MVYGHMGRGTGSRAKGQRHETRDTVSGSRGTGSMGTESGAWGQGYMGYGHWVMGTGSGAHGQGHRV
ncbi:hypothetical protein DPMN_063505 [Dreissena polymorpha]|uniref:Uncharacterized protein n=1 Tax=Dreissena polymorpha TaxID=45954 RepID=A0A9D4HIN5_DREPO|nr:hypothetical protein DPMN_063505 [Dreissena polymorpha]